MGFEPAFSHMTRTALGRKYRVNGEIASGRLFVSKEFTRTANLPYGQLYDNLQRHVSWVLWSRVTETLRRLVLNLNETVANCSQTVVIIPEAEWVLSKMGTDSPTYLVVYAAPVVCSFLLSFF